MDPTKPILGSYSYNQIYTMTTVEKLSKETINNSTDKWDRHHPWVNIHVLHHKKKYHTHN